MSSKTKSTTSGNQTTAFQFDPGSMAQYQQNLATWGPKARDFVNNPYQNASFQMESAIGQNNAAKLGARNMANLRGNAAAMGYNTSGGMFNSLLASSTRATSGMQSDAFRQSVMNANQRQMQSMGMLASFQPLMTGSSSNFNQTSQQQQSGLGTWLPQLISAGIGAAGSAFTGMPMMNSGGASAKTIGTAPSGVGQGMGNVMNGVGAVTGYGYGSQGPTPPPLPPGTWGA